MMQTAAKLKAQETARSLVYRRLADAFRLPSQDLPAVLTGLESSLARLCSDASEDIARLKQSYQTELGKCALEIDYAMLFVGPFLAPSPPYGSVYLEGNRRLMGNSTVDVRQHYLSLGLDLSPDFKEAPDHISAELEFMHVLIGQGMDAIEIADYRLLTDCVQHQQIFLEKHIGAWVPDFADKVIEYAQTGYYRHLAAVLQTFITEDMEDMEAIPDLAVIQATQVRVRA